MTESGWMYLADYAEVDRISNALPIDWVIGRLYGELPNSGNKIHCIAPQHADSTPSLKLWSPENPNLLTRLHCYGCGLKGDVFDVIDMYYGSNGHTMEVAAQMLDEYENGDHHHAMPRMRDESAAIEFQFNWEDMQRVDVSDAMIQAFLMRKKLFGRVPMEYCRDEWRWLGSNRGQGMVAMPHFTSEGVVTGVKLRSALDLANKFGFAWSQYPELYGAWRDQGHQHVVITEGETDCVLAAWDLRDQPCDVVAIPTGVSQTPTPAMKAELAGRDVHIVFDGDDRGDEGRDRWIDALGDTVHTIQAHAVPRGHDVCNSPVSILAILGVA